MRYSVHTALALVGLAALALWLTPDFLSGYAYALGKIAMFVASVSLVDNVLFKSFDTNRELRGSPYGGQLGRLEEGENGPTITGGYPSGYRPPNLAYAIYLASVHLGIALCIYAL